MKATVPSRFLRLLSIYQIKRRHILQHCYLNLKVIRSIYHTRTCRRMVLIRGTYIDFILRTGIVVPLQTHCRPCGSRRLRLPDSRQSAHKGFKLQPKATAAFTLQEIFLVLISVRGWVNPRSIVRPEGLCQWHHRESNPQTSGLWRSAWNNCVTACPFYSTLISKVNKLSFWH